MRLWLRSVMLLLALLIPRISAAQGVAVLELFTSQGCSSCPPADKLLIELAKQYSNSPVFPLSLHVDYWNDLGWDDPYSSRLATNRQHAYAETLGSSQVYTPQLIINGTTVVPATRRKQIQDAITMALASPVSHAVDGKLQRTAKGATVKYAIAPASTLMEVVLVVYTAGRVNKVERGENAGTVSHHSNVVRDIVREPLTSSGTGQLSWSGAPEENFGYLLLLQHLPTKRIVAAKLISDIR